MGWFNHQLVTGPDFFTALINRPKNAGNLAGICYPGAEPWGFMIPNLMVVSIFFQLGWGKTHQPDRHERLEFYMKCFKGFFLSKCGRFFKMCKSSFTASSVSLGFLDFFVGGSLKKYMLVCCFLIFRLVVFDLKLFFVTPVTPRPTSSFMVGCQLDDVHQIFT